MGSQREKIWHQNRSTSDNIPAGRLFCLDIQGASGSMSHVNLSWNQLRPGQGSYPE